MAGRWCAPEGSLVFGGGGSGSGGSEASGDSKWEAEWTWCGGPALSYFQDEYLTAAELFPTRVVRFYDLELPVPREPWALLNRTYGRDCAYMARLNEHGGVTADLRRPEHARLSLPAPVTPGGRPRMWRRWRRRWRRWRGATAFGAV